MDSSGIQGSTTWTQVAFRAQPLGLRWTQVAFRAQPLGLSVCVGECVARASTDDNMLIEH
eukprot:7159617-Alexandrium_andersonii.AAC.1